MNNCLKVRVPRAIPAVVILSISLGLLSTGGCYREVVSKRGLTVDARHPRKAQSSETNIDKAIDKVIKEIEN
ncbi:MAG: hypothetical protein AB8C13_09685 [Phycisphaerales bacterium]